MPSFGERLKQAWNAFTSRDPTMTYHDYGGGYSYRPDRFRFSRGSERTIVNAIYNRIAIDSAQIKMVHARIDENERFIEEINSTLNDCLRVEANVDQTGRAFIQDIVMSMLDEGCVAVVPVETSSDPNLSSSYDIGSLRVGKVVQWYPRHVRVSIYNDRKGRHEEVVMAKNAVLLIENPFYSVMNEPNSTLQRLIRKLNILDAIDAQTGSGKMDIIIQLPYQVKTEARRAQIEKRRKDIEMQLSSSEYGIAYADATEKIVQLNRPVDNQVMSHVEYLTNMLYSQLSMSEEVLKGTADEKTMLNYYNRTIEPILSAIADEMARKFLTKTARSQGQAIQFFRDPFKLVPVNELAEITDKMTRNEVLTSNEIRATMGYKPSSDPKADELRNSNLNYTEELADPNDYQEGYVEDQAEYE